MRGDEEAQRGRWEVLARSGYRHALAASCCPPESCCPSPPEPAAAPCPSRGAGSGQPRAGGVWAAGPKGATKEREKLAGSRQRLRRGLKHQPLAPRRLRRSGQAVKVFLPWGSGSAELGGKQGRWSGPSQGSSTGASWPLGLCEREAATPPRAISSTMLKSPTPQKPWRSHAHTELCYTTTNLPFFYGS